jgi:hypothetical protein
MRFRSRVFFSIALALPFGAACSSAEAPANPAGEAPVEPAATNLEPIAEVALSATHRVAFYEARPGFVMVSEVGEIGVDLDTSIPDYTRTADLYAKLAGNKVDPSALARLESADARAEALEANNRARDPEPEHAGVPVSTGSEMVDKHSDFLNGSQCQASSFEGGYCLGPKWNQITGSDSGWQYCTQRFRSTVFNHRYTASTSSAIHRIFHWGTEGDFWDEVGETWVERGFWHSWFSNWKYVKTTTGRATGQVTPGNHDQCILDRALNQSDWGTCTTAVPLCRIQ